MNTGSILAVNKYKIVSTLLLFMSLHHTMHHRCKNLMFMSHKLDRSEMNNAMHRLDIEELLS